jgi:hypothetical protein
VIRYQIKHDRDRQTKPGSHWNVYEIETEDPHRPPECVAWGSHEACLAFAVGLVELRATTGVRP